MILQGCGLICLWSILNPIMHWNDGIYIMMSNFILCALTASFLGQYIILYLVATKVPPLLESLAEVCRQITDPGERKILSDYAGMARKMNSILLVSFMVCPVSSFFNPVVSKIMDKYSPLGDGLTREYILVPMEFLFFKQDDHYLFSSWLATASGTSNCLAGALICCMYILIIKPTCGMFRITCHRLEKVAGNGQNSSPSIHGHCRKYFRDAVELHIQATRLVDQLESVYSFIILSFQITAVIMMSLSYFYVAKVRGVPIVRHYSVISLIIGFNAMLFCFNALGQEVTDVSEDVFNTAYECDWYSLQPNDRKFVSIILHRSLHPIYLTAGKISVLGHETFGAISKASLSYFTILKTIT